MDSQEKNFLLALVLCFAAWALVSCARDRELEPRRPCPEICWTNETGELTCHGCEAREPASDLKDERPGIIYEGDE